MPEFPEWGAGDRKDGVSASGKIRWQVVRVDDNGISEVLISEAGQGASAPYKLCEAVSVGNAKASVAPDDSWIIVHTGGGSLGISLTVIRRENDMIYKEMPGLDIGTEVLLSACGVIRRRRMRWIMFTWMSLDGRRLRDRCWWD